MRHSYWHCSSNAISSTEAPKREVFVDTPTCRILVVDDEVGIREVCERTLSRRGYAIKTAPGSDEALALMEQETFDIVLTDLRMPGIDGTELLRRIKRLYPVTEVIIISAENTLQAAIESLKIGAFDYILKPFNLGELEHCINRAMECIRLRADEMIYRETTYLYQLAHEIEKSHKKEDILGFVLQRAGTALSSDSGSLHMFLPEHRLLRLMAFFGMELTLHTEVKLGDRVVGWVAKNKQPLLINSLSEMPQFKEMAERHEIASSMVVPLVKHDQLLGIICLNRFTYQTNRKYSQADFESFQVFATHAALILALQFENLPPHSS